MKGRSTLSRRWTLAHGSGLAALVLSAVLAPMGTGPAVVPLGLFVLLCLAAPFCPRWGFFLPVISRGPEDRRAVALTFDDGPDPAVTPRLIALLERWQVKATFFVVGQKVEQERRLLASLIEGGHEVGNHSYLHDPLLMLRSRKRLADEISRTQEILATLGIRPLVFRPPVGITNPRLGCLMEEAGLRCVTFNCRAGDFGNRRIRGLARKILAKVRPGAIILLHDVAPIGFDVEAWLSQVEEIIVGLRIRDYDLVTLSGLGLGPCMVRIGPPGWEGPASGGKG